MNIRFDAKVLPHNLGNCIKNTMSLQTTEPEWQMAANTVASVWTECVCVCARVDVYRMLVVRWCFFPFSFSVLVFFSHWTINIHKFLLDLVPFFLSWSPLSHVKIQKYSSLLHCFIASFVHSFIRMLNMMKKKAHQRLNTSV